MELAFDDSETARELVERTRAFMDEVVIPTEREEFLSGGDMTDAVIEALRAEARDRGLYAPQLPEEYGGLGLDFRDVLPMFEEAGRSLLGPPALRVDAPDEGNMHTIEMVGTDAQKEEWLRPLVAGEYTSAFSMTEPMQGGGSDPKMLQTTAEKDGDEWVIDGHKWWTSQGDEADVLLVMARTNQEAHPYEGCSFFLVPPDTEGVELRREVPYLGDAWGIGHPEVIYDGVRVPEENLLGPKDEGFQIAQRRLGPARLTHCMRFSGMAQRAISVAKAYVHEREGFGEALSNKQSLRFKIARAETRLYAVRTQVRHAARQIARGNEARTEVAMCKVFAANVVNDIIDDMLQLCGGNGIARDLPIAHFYEEVRAFRIFDGADEVHLRSIARASFENVDREELATVTRF
ncbi:acyl-CoA dehydrogenase family protein [Haloglomus litoreum]|uniref:acyl-CoA dehydrogenase family protein n=1 Tax=Haloglomus litoreum TaxID=3034026 RepID=UPI0023E8994B|nr:acyl-CoA dehydrogenase family protein [Haloglomus sp. DT116]